MKLSSHISKTIFIISFVSISLAFIISLVFQYSSYKRDSEHIQNVFMEIKKENIKREVLRVHDFIDKKQEEIQNKLKQRLKERVLIAHKIALSIYEENKDIKSEEEIKYLIVTTLKNLSYKNKNSYIFANSNDSKPILFNKKSKLNDKIKTSEFKKSIYDAIAKRQSTLALEKDSGYILNDFIKPDTDDKTLYKKLSFIKLFKPYNWHIGTGEYVDTLTQQTKNELLDWIATVRFGQNGYIFVNDLKKQSLIFDGKKLSPPAKHTRPDLYQLQLDAIKPESDGFMLYKFKKINTKISYSKISYVKEYKKWGWIIGTGLYLDDMDKELARKEGVLKDAINNQITTIFLIILLLTIIIYYISKKISQYMDKNIYHLINSFKYASSNSEEIDTKELTYQEFEVLGKSLNKTLKARNKSEAKLQDYIKIVNENVIISTTDKRGIITSVSEAFCEISGYTKEELIGKSHNIVRQKDTPKELYKQMWNCIQNGKSWVGEIKNRNKEGGEYWVEAIIQPIFNKQDISGYTAIRHDITDKKKVEYLSITDELTNLYNRRFFNQKIEEEINRAKREDYYLSFIMLDIDYFKKYNDTYGHQAGDNALTKVAKELALHNHRASDFVFRLGGEEFGILFLYKDKESSLEFANFLRTCIEKLEIEHKQNSASKYVTVSMGLVVRKGKDIIDSDDLYKLADEALYKAKESGRNTTYIM
ncbi:MAG: cache domain-containing protein [Poseidonibacter sp.]|uniref:cache domain-containing protein n=1 Tax=Poseidonibacter sp. TaxID=2321188 RepID=UPI00359DD944